MKKTMTLAMGDKFSLDCDYWIEYDYGWDDGFSVQDAVFVDIERVYITIADKETDIEIDSTMRATFVQQIIEYDEDNHKNKIW
jgi:hypothetical protein